MNLPRIGEVIEVPNKGLCEVRRILPNGFVEAIVRWSAEKIKVRRVLSWEEIG